MAWSEKLPSGRYRGVYRDGLGKRRSAGTHTHKAKAERAAAAREAEARRRIRADPEGYKRPWGEWVTEWWETRSVEPSTAKVDRYRLDKHLAPRWGDVPLGSIRRQDVKAWAAGLRRGGSSPATVRRCVRLLSVSLEAAVDAELVESNVAARLKLYPEPHDVERFLTREEYAAIRDEMPSTFDQLVIDVLVGTGMRWGEFAGLHVDRLDLAGDFGSSASVRVVETWNDATSTMKGYPKGKRSRSIPLRPELADALREHLAEHPPARACGYKHSVGSCRSGLAFTTPSGSPLRGSNWVPIWRDATARAGITARPYDLRHTFASWLLQRGVPLAEVGRLMGHISTATTQRYAHLAETPDAMILDAMGPLLDGAPFLPHSEKRGTESEQVKGA